MTHVSDWNPRAMDVPYFGGRRLLLIGTGSSAAVFLPFWINWFTFSYPEVECQVVLTRSAQWFVTQEALRSLGPSKVFEDAWSPEARSSGLHVKLAQWPDSIAVYPAGMNFIGRFALGLADTPALLALQCTSATVGVAAALPPGGWESAAMLRHRRELESRPNVALLPPTPGLSMTTGRRDGNPPAGLPKLISLMERHRTAEQERSPAPG